MKQRHLLRDRLSTERALVGFLQTHPNAAVAEMAALCGYDFLMLDCEHGLFSEMDLLQTLQVLRGSDTAAFVRLRGNDTQAVGRYMDLGADAIVVPNVETREQAKALVQAMHYPPAGTRGYGAPVHRGTRYGIDCGAHIQSPREGVFLVPMIESARGLANVEEIIATDGVDGVIIGPSDLSAALGSLGDFTQRAYVEAFARIERAAMARGKLVGTAAHPGNSIEALITRGHRLLIIGGDTSLMREAMSCQVTTAKLCLQGNKPQSIDR